MISGISGVELPDCFKDNRDVAKHFEISGNTRKEIGELTNKPVTTKKNYSKNVNKKNPY